MDNNISFKSRINFVTLNKFEDIVGGSKINHLSRNILNSKEFYSFQIRTCTGGGIVSPLQREACGFHILHSHENAECMSKIIKKIFRFARTNNPERALIIGGKDITGARFSMYNFREIKNALLKKVPHVTVFEEHLYRASESSIHYNLQKDTWSIYSNRGVGQNFEEVLTPESLKQLFKKVRIADGDELFINGKKILKEDYPEFFDATCIKDYIRKFFRFFLAKEGLCD